MSTVSPGSEGAWSFFDSDSEETAKLTSGGDVSWNRNFGRTSRPTAGDVDLRAGYVPLWSIDYVEADLLNANQVLSTIRYFK